MKYYAGCNLHWSPWQRTSHIIKGKKDTSRENEMCGGGVRSGQVTHRCVALHYLFCDNDIGLNLSARSMFTFSLCFLPSLPCKIFIEWFVLFIYSFWHRMKRKFSLKLVYDIYPSSLRRNRPQLRLVNCSIWEGWVSARYAGVLLLTLNVHSSIRQTDGTQICEESIKIDKFQSDP